MSRCDFLSIDIVDREIDSGLALPGTTSSSPEMSRDSFNVVVFSLLLSYLPCTEQRLKCCVNAHQVLQPHGLLLVVSPDSSHQNRHAALMKQWKHCIEDIGFHR